MHPGHALLRVHRRAADVIPVLEHVMNFEKMDPQTPVLYPGNDQVRCNARCARPF
jgi:hypothetical protein